MANSHFPTFQCDFHAHCKVTGCGAVIKGGVPSLDSFYTGNNAYVNHFKMHRENEKFEEHLKVKIYKMLES